MNGGSSSIPGFRSLSQAGIRLQEGLETAPVSEAAVNQVKAGSEDPSWPPLPTMSQGTESPVEKTQQAQTVAVQPREPGMRRPAVREPEHFAGQTAASPIPTGVYMGDLPSQRFSCPSCSVVLTIPNPKAYNGQPAPCPHCAALILPPQVVSPFAVVPEESLDPQRPRMRHYSGFSL